MFIPEKGCHLQIKISQLFYNLFLSVIPFFASIFIHEKSRYFILWSDLHARHNLQIKKRCRQFYWTPCRDIYNNFVFSSNLWFGIWPMTMRESMKVIKRFHIDCSHDVRSKIPVQIQIYLLIYYLFPGFRVIECAVGCCGKNEVGSNNNKLCACMNIRSSRWGN